MLPEEKQHNAITDQIIAIRLHRQPFNRTMIQIYVPTMEAEREEVESFIIRFNLKSADHEGKRGHLLLEIGTPKLETLWKKTSARARWEPSRWLLWGQRKVQFAGQH